MTMPALLGPPAEQTSAANSSSQKATETIHTDSLQRSGSIYFRITGIPLSWNQDRLLNTLKTVEPSIKETLHEISLYPSCGGGRQSQTALLILNTCTAYFSRIKTNQANFIKVVGECGRPVCLGLDRHFWGLTPLNTPEEPVADIVAVAGFASHPIGAWRDDETECMWLRDFLPDDIQNVRIMTYGYNSSLEDHRSSDHFEEYRSDLLQYLSNSRRTVKEKTRPIIFIGHGTGGTLILQALLKSKIGTQYRDTFTSTRQILLFGVPHQGMEVEEILSMIEETGGKSSTRLDLVKQLSKESSNFLNTQREDIIDLWPTGSDIRIVSFYERKMSPMVKTDPSAAGKLSSSEKLLVNKNSAVLFWPGEYRIGVPSNHTNLVKFATSADDTYGKVIQHMTTCIEEITASQRMSEDNP